MCAEYGGSVDVWIRGGVKVSEQGQPQGSELGLGSCQRFRGVIDIRIRLAVRDI